MKLLLVTQNTHKRREFSRLLPGHEVMALPDDFVLPPETGETFAQNALRKARAAADHARALGALSLADDSGIEAQALGGAPGVRSARYAGEHASDAQNLAKLLRQAPQGSALRYVCALALVDPGKGEDEVIIGTCEGTLTYATRGQRGFGYDPAFVPDEQPPRATQPLTMAQLSDAEKDAISHRGRALRDLLHLLNG